MKNVRNFQPGNRKTMPSAERGVALVIAIFTLMLISVVATALILMAGTASAIKANYKSSMQAFYDAKAGLEEGRSRLWAGNANPVRSCVFPAPGTPMPANRVCYIINSDPTTGETVDPIDLSATNPYADREYAQEFGTDVTSASVQPFITSTSPMTSPNIAGPLYKWVRITPVTQQSSGTGTQTAPFFYDGLHLYDPNDLADSGISNPGQILAITALAVTPNGSRRLLQSTVAQPILSNVNFPSAVTLDGNGVSFQGPSGGNFYVNGNDLDAPPNSNVGIPAVGYTNSSDSSNVVPTPANHYPSPGTPSVGVLPSNALPPSLQTPSGLDALVQQITASADAVITGPVTQSNSHNIFPTGMSAANPMVVVVNGDLTFSSWYNSGYGLLLVTGKLTYDPDATWSGIILVIGQGEFYSYQGGNGRINGTVLVARTHDSSNKLLPDPNLGAAWFKQTGGGNGVYYSSKSVKAAQARIPYQVLSFREIPQQTP